MSNIPLSEVFQHYGHPDPNTVGVITKNGVDLAYVGHAEITKALTEIDSQWTWTPVLGTDGLPAIRIQDGEIPRRDKEPIPVRMATMWGTLTLNGVTRWAVGSVEAHKPDLDKELVSDFLRNAAMRFGVALGLWMKDTGTKTTSERTERPQSVTNDSGVRMATDGQERTLYAISKALEKLPPAKGTLTFAEASAMIDKLKEEQIRRASNEIEEEPF